MWEKQLDFIIILAQRQHGLIVDIIWVQGPVNIPHIIASPNRR